MENQYSPSANFVKENAKFQGIDPRLSERNKQNTKYPGVDSLQNATVNDNYIYISTYDAQHDLIVSGNILPEKHALMGYFSNEATASNRINSDGTFDAYGYHRDVCVTPFSETGNAADAVDKSHLDRFYIDRDRLEQIYGTRDFNAAIGKCHANNQYGSDGGDQGYNPYLNELYNNGCIKYDGTNVAAPGSIYECQNDFDKMQGFREDKCGAVMSGESAQNVQKIGYPIDDRCHQNTAFNADPIADINAKYQNYKPQYNETLAKSTTANDRRTPSQNRANAGPEQSQIAPNQPPAQSERVSAGTSDAVTQLGSRSPAEKFPAGERQAAGSSIIPFASESLFGASQGAGNDMAASAAENATQKATGAVKSATGGIV